MIPPKTITVGVLHEEIPNPMYQAYQDGWKDCVAELMRILEQCTIPAPKAHEAEDINGVPFVSQFGHLNTHADLSLIEQKKQQANEALVNLIFEAIIEMGSTTHNETPIDPSEWVTPALVRVWLVKRGMK